jgi:predicted CoA-binding protein
MSSNIVESEEELARIVREGKTVAVWGMRDGKDDEHAPAFAIPKVLKQLGWRVIPVNPRISEALGERAYADLASVPEPFDVVDVFRRSEAVGEVADQVLALPPERRPRVFWMQTGIKNAEVADRLAKAGIQVVQDRCLKTVSQRYRAG